MFRQTGHAHALVDAVGRHIQVHRVGGTQVHALQIAQPCLGPASRASPVGEVEVQLCHRLL